MQEWCLHSGNNPRYLGVESSRYLGVFSFQGFEYMLHNQNNTRAVLIALLNDMHETL